jgi:hypothetical protein
MWEVGRYNSEHDAEEVWAERTTWIVFSPRSAQCEEHLLQEILCLGHRHSHSSQRPVNVIQLAPEGVQAGFIGRHWVGGRRQQTEMTHGTQVSNCRLSIRFVRKNREGSSNGQSGTLTTAYDGASPKSWNSGGGLVLGVGGDNSNHSFGTFFEGALTMGRPSDATDAAVLAHVQAAGYGK